MAICVFCGEDHPGAITVGQMFGFGDDEGGFFNNLPGNRPAGIMLALGGGSSLLDLLGGLPGLDIGLLPMMETDYVTVARLTDHVIISTKGVIVRRTGSEFIDYPNIDSKVLGLFEEATQLDKEIKTSQEELEAKTREKQDLESDIQRAKSSLLKKLWDLYPDYYGSYDLEVIEKKGVYSLYSNSDEEKIVDNIGQEQGEPLFAAQADIKAKEQQLTDMGTPIERLLKKTKHLPNTARDAHRRAEQALQRLNPDFCRMVPSGRAIITNEEDGKTGFKVRQNVNTTITDLSQLPGSLRLAIKEKIEKIPNKQMTEPLRKALATVSEPKQLTAESAGG